MQILERKVSRIKQVSVTSFRTEFFKIILGNFDAVSKINMWLFAGPAPPVLKSVTPGRALNGLPFCIALFPGDPVVTNILLRLPCNCVEN